MLQSQASSICFKILANTMATREGACRVIVGETTSKLVWGGIVRLWVSILNGMLQHLHFSR